MMSPIYLEERDINLVILDFEGFQTARGYQGEKANKSRNNINSTESKLFALCSLISSTICFNINKEFNEKTLEDFEVIKDLHRLIKIRPPDHSANLMRERGTPGGRATADDQNYSEHLFP